MCVAEITKDFESHDVLIFCVSANSRHEAVGKAYAVASRKYPLRDGYRWLVMVSNDFSPVDPDSVNESTEWDDFF
jgi:hypothetical protein